MELSELKQVMTDLIAGMDAREQHLLTLLYHDNLTHREAAESAKIPIGSVHSVVKRIHQSLRQQLRK